MLRRPLLRHVPTNSLPQAKAKANEEGPWARLAKVLGGARSGAVPVEEAEEAIRAVEREAAAAKQAGLALVGLRVAKEVRGERGGERARAWRTLLRQCFSCLGRVG